MAKLMSTVVHVLMTGVIGVLFTSLSVNGAYQFCNNALWLNSEPNSYQQDRTTVAACQDKCDQTPSCKAFDFSARGCYIYTMCQTTKYAFSYSHYEKEPITCNVLKPNFSPTTLACPGGANFLSCDNTWAVGLKTTLTTTSENDCRARCAAADSCVGYTYLDLKNTCYIATGTGDCKLINPYVTGTYHEKFTVTLDGQIKTSCHPNYNQLPCPSQEYKVCGGVRSTAGVFQQGIQAIDECRIKCDQTLTCQGFDWLSGVGSCYLFNDCTLDYNSNNFNWQHFEKTTDPLSCEHSSCYVPQE